MPPPGCSPGHNAHGCRWCLYGPRPPATPARAGGGGPVLKAGAAGESRRRSGSGGRNLRPVRVISDPACTPIITGAGAEGRSSGERAGLGRVASLLTVQRGREAAPTSLGRPRRRPPVREAPAPLESPAAGRAGAAWPSSTVASSHTRAASETLRNQIETFPPHI